MNNPRRQTGLEPAGYERFVLAEVERIAREYDVDPERVLRVTREISDRIERWGYEAETRRQ